MSLAPVRTTAPDLSLAFAAAQRARLNAELVRAGADRLRVEGVSPTSNRDPRPAERQPESRAEIRDRIMIDHGLDHGDLARLPAQTRLEVEVSLNRETEARARLAGPRATGTLVDLRI